MASLSSAKTDAALTADHAGEGDSVDLAGALQKKAFGKLSTDELQRELATASLKEEERVNIDEMKKRAIQSKLQAWRMRCFHQLRLHFPRYSYFVLRNQCYQLTNVIS